MNPQDDSYSPIRVLVVNDSGFIREGLCRVIERFKGIEVVASIYCPEHLEEVAQQLRIDVALIDAQLPDKTGFEVTQRLRESGAKTRVVIQSVNPSLAQVRRALQAGANGFLLQDAGIAELEIALHAAVSGKIFLCPTILKRLSEVMEVDDIPQGRGMSVDTFQSRYSIEKAIGDALRLGILRQDQ